MKNRLIIFLVLAAPAVLGGCNGFSDHYSGARYPKSAHAEVRTLDESTLAQYRSSGYRVIGDSAFVDGAVDDGKIAKKARETGMKNGADVVLVGGEYIGDKKVEVQVISHYAWEDKWDGQDWVPSWEPQYVTETVQVPQYRYRGVFLKSPAPAGNVVAAAHG